MTIVGDHDPTLLKYFDCTRSGPRSAFDSNVVFQFEIMEYVSLLMILWAPNSYLSCLLTRYFESLYLGHWIHLFRFTFNQKNNFLYVFLFFCSK